MNLGKFLFQILSRELFSKDNPTESAANAEGAANVAAAGEVTHLAAAVVADLFFCRFLAFVRPRGCLPLVS